MAEHDHEHGTMDMKVQEQTFNSFVSFVTKTTIVILLILVVMALFFR